MILRRFVLALLTLSFAVPAALVRAQTEIASDEDKPAPKTKKKTPAKKKGFDYERSKYKSKEPSQTTNYKFNEKGEPISGEKKKAPAKKKKRSEPPEEDPLKPEGCGSEDNCAEKKSEADAL
ncbi:MAG: hypothetical protein HY923_01805 [Elusimicrobia bacterium]|nr:hypothetical protein [Elusimicrobiota bacterium]